MRTFEEIYKICRPYTMTSEARMKKLYESVVYINEKGIEGSLVECGVYKGGSVMNMILTQLNYQGRLVHTYLYDTFSGMTPESEFDINHEGKKAAEILKDPRKIAVASLSEVKKNISLTNYPPEFIHFRQGDVADTLKHDVPEKIALLRLDTDWYASTKEALERLYPHLVEKGVLILDDYGYWQGARKAVNEYFASLGIKPKLEPIEEGVSAVFLIKDSKLQDTTKLIALQRTSIKPNDYLKEVEKEYQELKPFLPKRIKKVLDIGCGLGGIDIFLYKDFKPEITFLDRDGIDDKVEYGYQKRPSKYNLLSETKKFVEKHGVNHAKYINIDKEPFPSGEFDLTISLFGMGYHFPITTYRPKTKYLIADIREGFALPKNSKIIKTGENYKRVTWQNS